MTTIQHIIKNINLSTNICGNGSAHIINIRVSISAYQNYIPFLLFIFFLFMGNKGWHQN